MGTTDLTRPPDELDDLDRAAAQAFNAGRTQEAERLWTQMRSIAPRHRNALFGLGCAALQQGEAVKARALLLSAHEAAPDDIATLMTLASACRACGDQDNEIAAIATALRVDPKHLPALLAKAEVLERIGHADAFAAYNEALAAAPKAWPEAHRAALEHAKDFTDRRKHSLFYALSQRMAALSSEMSPAELLRWREAASVMAQLTRPYNPECHKLFVPRLPVVPFFERAQFPWVKALEEKTDVIREELTRALAVKQKDFLPYVTLDRTGGETEEWKELNQSTRWSVFYLWKNGVRDEQNAALCPETMMALDLADQAHIAGACPNAMFSALAPRTRIPPHSGESNARLVCHLPLIVPENCGALRVGFEQRPWKTGEALFFDDSLEHEAWNDSDELRVVLLFDVWRPELSARDREMVNALVAAEAEFRAGR